MTQTKPNLSLSELRAAADRARTAYQWEEAVAHYTQALALPNLPPGDEYTLRDGRAACYQRLANFQAEHDDLAAMADLAQAEEESERYLDALTRQAIALSNLGEIEDSRSLAAEALETAQKSEARFYEGRALYALGLTYITTGEYERAAQELEAAIQFIQRSGALQEEALCAYQIAFAGYYMGQKTDRYAQRVLEIANQLDDRLLLGRAYHILGIIYYQSDLSLGLKYREQALEIYRAVGEVRGVGSMTHNLGVLYLELGLHKRAQTLFNEAVQIAETSGSRASFLLSLLMASSSGFQAGDTEAAEQANQRVIEEAHEAGYQGLEALASAMRGWMLWERGDLDPAVKIMQAAVEQVEVMPAYLPFVLGWLGRMYLERGDIPAALQTTEKALEWVGELHQPYFKETPYWSRYQVLQHIAKTPPEAEKAWDTLLQARDVLLDRIENIADRGLRRSYLSRRFANPDIILEWARHAYQRGESLAPLMEHAHPAGDIQQQFKRLLDTGTRLAAQSDPDRILVFVMDEFIELSGAERAFIALREEGDESLPQVVLFQGLGDEDETYAYEQAFPLIDQAVLSRQAVLSQKVGAAPEGEPPEIHLRSVVVVPLVSHSRVMGVLYGDIREIFTPFNRQDANLLTLLANQAAAALENANWTRTLEQRVRDRTIELETINKIGEGLLANLDLDGVLQVVGEHVQERFGTQNMIIAITEPSKGALLAPYLILNGKRLEPIQVAADQGVTSVVIRRNAPLLIASFEEIQDYPYVMPKEMQDNPPEEMSWIGVPLRRGEEAIGALIVFELRDHAYDESHVRLLSTIAANMGVALENARLFDEVQKSNRKLTEALEQQTATSDILRVIAESPTDIQPVLEVIARHAAQLSGSEDAIIAIKEEETLKVVAHDGDVPMIPVGEGIPFNRDSVAGRAMIEGRPLQAIHNQRGVKSKYPQGDKVANKYGYRTSSAVPLMREGKAVGVITIRRTKPILLTDKQILLVQSFANQAAIAVENVRLFNETTRLLKETEARNAELAVINSVQSGLASKLDIHSIFELVGERISEIFPEHSVALFTYESETDTAEAMFMLERGSRHYPPPFQPGPIGKHMNETKKPLMLSTRGEFEAIGAITIEGTEASQSGIYAPLVVDDDMIGALNIENPDREHTFTESDLRLVTTLANSMSVALENARLFDETQRLLKETEERNAELAVINSVQEGLVAQMDIQAIFDLVGDTIYAIFDTQVVIISTFDHARERKHIRYNIEKGKRYYPEPSPFNDLQRHLIRTRQPVVILDNASEKRADFGMDTAPGTEPSKSLVFVPLLVGERVNGFISLQNVDREHAFSGSDVRLLQTLANSMSVALENARLFDETQRLLKETEERNAELAVINSVQQGLAAELDIQAIFDLVGDTIRDIFDAQVVLINTYNLENERVHNQYSIEKGKRIFPDPFPFNELHRHIIRTHKTILINENAEEVGAELGMHTIPGTEAAESLVFVPMVVGEHIKGVVSLQNTDREGAFSDSDVRLLQTLANSMSVALENARLFDETQRLLKETEERNAELALITSVQQGLAAELDYQSIVDLVGNQIRGIFNAQMFGIGFFNDSEDAVNILYLYEKGERYYPEPMQLGGERGLLRKLISTRKTIHIEDTENEDQFLEYGIKRPMTIPGTEPGRSILFVPLMLAGNVFGAISLQNIDETKAFSESDVRLLETIANSTSIALENARLFDETQHLLEETEARNAELALINKIQEGLVAELDLDAIYHLVGDEIQGIFNAQSVMLFNIDYKNELYLIKYLMEDGKKHFPDPIPMDPTRPATAHIVKNRQTLYMRNLEEQKTYGISTSTIGDTQSMQSMIFVPLVVRDVTQGVISLQSEQEEAFSDSDIRLLNTIANTMSIALENARLFDETQRLLKETEERNAELAVINKIQEGLAAELDLDAIYHLVGDAIQAIFNAQSVGLAVIDYENELNQIKYLMEDGKKHFPDPLPLDLTRPSQAHLVESRQTLYIRNREEQRVFSMGDATIEGTLPMQSMIFVPLVVRDVTQGVITLQSEQEEAFSDSDIRLLNTIANTMSVALENARLFDETQRLLEETEQRASELAIINDVQAGLVARVEMGEIYNLVGDRVQEIFDAEVVVINRFDLENRRSHYEYTVEKGERFSVEPQPFNPIIEDYIENKHTFLANEGVAEILEAAGAPVVAGEAPLSILAVPLMSSGRVVGSISLQNVSREHAFNPSDVQLLETLAASLSIALENARLFDETQRRARETAALVEVGHDISATLDLSNVLKRIANHARELLEASDCAVFLPDETGEIMRGSIALGPIAEQVKATIVRPGIGVLGDLWLRRESEVINDAANDPRAVTIAGTETQRDERMLAAPLLSGENVYGMMAVWRTGKPYSEIDLNFLEGLARHAAIAIQNARLFEEALAARQAAEQANKAKSTFLANMSHELRTPLNAITGFTRIVKRKGADVLPDKQVQNLDKVLVSADHLLGLINTVLDIAKIEAGRMEVQPASFDFHPLADLVLATTQPLVESSVKLVSEVPAELPRLHTDQDKLKQIMINLLSNAAKFTHEGRITLRARAGDGLLSVEVQDTGIGISPDKLEKIFEEFQQADTSTTRQYGGTGLGLSISKSLAQLLGGDMTATSVEGGGSTFTLSIPLRYGETPLPERSEPAPLADIHKPTGQPLILSIDDDPNVHDLLKENLGERGYQVIGALSGEEGLRLARELSPFAITLDIMMPHKDGWQVLHELKADPATRDIPVILVTIVDKQALGYQLGAADYLVKPLEEDAVYAALQHIPSNKSQGDPPAHLLVVDDDPNIPDMVRQLLADAPYRIDSESNGQAALEAIRRQPPDVILLDLMMPRMDGFALIESLRKEDIRVPIIVLTAKTLNTVDLEILEESVERIIQKNGLDRERLLAELRRTLEEVGKWREDGLSTKDEGRGAKGEG